MKVNIKTSYNWGKKRSEESLTPSEDGSIIIKRQIPSDAGNVELEVRWHLVMPHFVHRLDTSIFYVFFLNNKKMSRLMKEMGACAKNELKG